jgi:hypothetical protein
LTAKKLLAFKSNTKLPAPQLEQNLGLLLLTLFATFTDPTLKLTPDKSALLDRSWTTGVLPYLQNSGRVLMESKRLKEAMDYQAT